MKIIKVFGPNLEHSTSNLNIDSDDVLFIEDVFDDHALESFLLKNNRPKYIVNDHFSCIEFPNFFIHTIHWFLAVKTEVELFKTPPVIEPATPVNDTIFNFIINKKQINRFLCIKLVEFFELTNFDYTWSGVDNQFGYQSIIEELDALGTSAPLDNNTRSKILSPINLEPRFFNFPESKIIAESHVENYGGIKWTWNNGLDKVFSHSAVSLITESMRYQKGAVLTEKTAYSIMGLTFPIWIGGYGQAQEFEKIGFDAFNDIVDHSYQHYDTLIERCYYAFEKNLRLLTDQNYTYNLRNSCMDRLKNNFELLRNLQTQKYCREQISTWPEDLQVSVGPILTRFK